MINYHKQNESSLVSNQINTLLEFGYLLFFLALGDLCYFDKKNQTNNNSLN